MEWSFALIFSSALLGVGLAMDAFSVSLANGLTEPKMSLKKMLGVSGTYAIFQWAMPMIGWILVHTVAAYFTFFQTLVPWIAFLLLGYIGGKMILEAVSEMRGRCTKGQKEYEDAPGKTAEEDPEDAPGNSGEDAQGKVLGFGMLMVQGIATSIDALSVGFTTTSYGWLMAMVSAVIIGLVTWVITFIGLGIGKKFGTKLAGKATLVGGLILVGIGIKILAESFL